MSPRLSVYLDPDLMAQLAELATRRNESLSLIVEAAMASFLKADEAHRREAAIMRRLNRLAREIKRLKRDLSTYVETLAPLIQFLLTVTPPSPDGAGTGGQLSPWSKNPRSSCCRNRIRMPVIVPCRSRPSPRRP